SCIRRRRGSGWSRRSSPLRLLACPPPERGAAFGIQKPPEPAGWIGRPPWGNRRLLPPRREVEARKRGDQEEHVPSLQIATRLARRRRDCERPEMGHSVKGPGGAACRGGPPRPRRLTDARALTHSVGRPRGA